MARLARARNERGWLHKAFEGVDAGLLRCGHTPQVSIRLRYVRCFESGLRLSLLQGSLSSAVRYTERGLETSLTVRPARSRVRCNSPSSELGTGNFSLVQRTILKRSRAESAGAQAGVGRDDALPSVRIFRWVLRDWLETLRSKLCEDGTCSGEVLLRHVLESWNSPHKVHSTLGFGNVPRYERTNFLNLEYSVCWGGAGASKRRPCSGPRQPRSASPRASSLWSRAKARPEPRARRSPAPR